MGKVTVGFENIGFVKWPSGPKRIPSMALVRWEGWE